MQRVKGILKTYIRSVSNIFCAKSVLLNSTGLRQRVKPISTLYLQIGLGD